MRTIWNSVDTQAEVMTLIIGVLDHVVIPITIKQVLVTLWYKSELQYYLSSLYRDKDNPKSHDDLSCTLYNLLTLDPPEGSLCLKDVPPLPWSKDTLTHMMRLSRFQFKGNVKDDVYRHRSFGQVIAAQMYSLIHKTRYLIMDSEIHYYQRKLYIFLQKPSLLVSRPLTNIGTPSIAFIINAAIAEEFIFRYFLQGFILKFMPSIMFFSAKKLPDFIMWPFVFLRVITQAVFFAASHNSDQFADLFRLISGIVYGVIYELTGSIFTTSLAHAAYNFRCSYMHATQHDLIKGVQSASVLDPLPLLKSKHNFLVNLKDSIFALVGALMFRFAFSYALSKEENNSMLPLSMCFIGLAAWFFYTNSKDNQSSQYIFEMVEPLPGMTVVSREGFFANVKRIRSDSLENSDLSCAL